VSESSRMPGAMVHSRHHGEALLRNSRSPVSTHIDDRYLGRHPVEHSSASQRRVLRLKQVGQGWMVTGPD
jgi:hypothetical protein